MPELTDAQQYERGRVYDTIARCMPTEGRDFKVEMVFLDGERMPAVDVVPLNATTAAWAQFCAAVLHRTYGGVNAGTDGTCAAAAGAAAVPGKKRVL